MDNYVRVSINKKYFFQERPMLLCFYRTSKSNIIYLEKNLLNKNKIVYRSCILGFKYVLFF